MPVEVLGLDGTPEAGDVLNVVDDEAQAREIADYRERLDARQARGGGLARPRSTSCSPRPRPTSDVKELPVVVKADVQGSAEAIVQALEKLSTDEVRIRVLHSGVGAITESDVTLAEASGAPIIGFNVRANAPAREAANQKGVEIRYYSIIYNLVDDVKAAASGLLARRSARSSSATPRSCRCSRSPASARSPAAASPRASSAARPACACCATTW